MLVIMLNFSGIQFFLCILLVQHGFADHGSTFLKIEEKSKEEVG